MTRFFVAFVMAAFAVTIQAKGENDGTEWVATWATATEFTG